MLFPGILPPHDLVIDDALDRSDMSFHGVPPFIRTVFPIGKGYEPIILVSASETGLPVFYTRRVALLTFEFIELLVALAYFTPGAY